MKIIRGDTIDEKISSIDKALEQHQRRLSRTIVGIIPPVPILHSVQQAESDGTIFYNIIPVAGSMRTLCIGREIVEQKETTVTITVTGSEVGYSYTLIARRHIEVFELEYPITVGDRIRISLPGASPGRVLVALAIMPDLARSVKDVQMLDALHKLEESMQSIEEGSTDADQDNQEEERTIQRKHAKRRQSKRHHEGES